VLHFWNAAGWPKRYERGRFDTDAKCTRYRVMVRWTFLEDLLEALGAMMILLPLAALGLFIALIVFL